MPEGKKDRLGKREGFEEGSLDKVAQDFFGYTDWTEYKQDNKQDLGGPTKRGAGTERWSGIEGPTLHPVHVGFAVQEFLASVNPENYVAILYTVGKGSDPSLRPGKVTSVFKKAATTSEYRNKFFGDEVAENAIDKTGVLTYAMYEPREGLKNKKVITRLINSFLTPGINKAGLNNIQVVNTNNQPIKKVGGEGGYVFKVAEEGTPLTLGLLIKEVKDLQIKKNSFGIPIKLEGGGLEKGVVLIVPKNIDQKLTEPEIVLARRIGARIP